LLAQKIAVPDRVAGYLDRAKLIEFAMPTRRRLTVLQAPGGFGKTTLFAECCRRLRDDGVHAAWVSVEDQDEPDVLDTYIAYACESAAPGAAGLDGLTVLDLGQLSPGTTRRSEIAMHAIADLDGPFVLVLDGLERIGDSNSAALVELLLRRGPPNLHLAFACRGLPPGVNVAAEVLEGRAAILSADDLRFSRAELEAFFDGKLTRERLAALMSESAGWPFAVRIFRNELRSGGRNSKPATREFVDNWVESRLFAGLADEDREFLLDVGLFEWIDAPLLDDVLERNDSSHRIETLPVLEGMLAPVRDGATDCWRLHPLIREHCVRQRFREAPQRFRTIHRRIADALARRGQTAAAMRHAAEAGEPTLVGEIMERAGGVGLFIREGLVQFRAAERQLSEDVVRMRPRLGLARCAGLVLSGRMAEAKGRYRSIAAQIGPLDVDADDAALELAAENCWILGMIGMYGGEGLGAPSIQTCLRETAQLAESRGIDVHTRGIMEYGLCIADGMAADFTNALDHAERARAYLRRSRHMTMLLDLQVGQIAMAQGKAEDAAAHYGRAERVATTMYGAKSERAAMCEALSLELALECGRASPNAVPDRILESLSTGSSPVLAYAAVASALLDMKFLDAGVESALAAAADMLGYVRGAGLPPLVRYVSALRVSLLADAGRSGDGEAVWAAAGLPDEAAGCLDLAGQSWREMEALSCARLRIAIGRRRFEEGRVFAERLRGVASGRGLRRTLMRAFVLSAVLERRAGETAAMAGHLHTYAGLYAETPYAGPLYRERDDCEQLLATLPEAGSDAPSRGTARLLRAAAQRAENPSPPQLSARERDVLLRLEGQRDKQIATALGLSTYGVRYHMRNLFNKLRVQKRADAVRRGRELGLLPDDS